MKEVAFLLPATGPHIQRRRGSRTEKRSYLGGLAQAGYNYFLFKKRINIGASLAVRFYPTLPVQYYTNVNLGYRFNLLRRR